MGLRRQWSLGRSWLPRRVPCMDRRPPKRQIDGGALLITKRDPENLPGRRIHQKCHSRATVQRIALHPGLDPGDSIIAACGSIADAVRIFAPGSRASSSTRNSSATSTGWSLEASYTIAVERHFLPNDGQILCLGLCDEHAIERILHCGRGGVSGDSRFCDRPGAAGGWRSVVGLAGPNGIVFF
jgi:hypothetical protein